VCSRTERLGRQGDHAARTDVESVLLRAAAFSGVKKSVGFRLPFDWTVSRTML